MKIFYHIFYILITILLLYIIYNDFTLQYKEKVVYKFDTLIIKEPEIIKIEKVKPIIIYKRDTVIKTPPFIAVFDTVYKHDTIKIKYEFPENIFDLSYIKSSDTIKVEKYIFNEFKYNRKDWFEPAISFLIGLGTGYIIFK